MFCSYFEGCANFSGDVRIRVGGANESEAVSVQLLVTSCVNTYFAHAYRQSYESLIYFHSAILHISHLSCFLVHLGPPPVMRSKKVSNSCETVTFLCCFNLPQTTSATKGKATIECVSISPQVWLPEFVCF